MEHCRFPRQKYHLLNGFFSGDAQHNTIAVNHLLLIAWSQKQKLDLVRCDSDSENTIVVPIGACKASPAKMRLQNS